MFAAAALLPLCVSADSSHKGAHKAVSDKVIAKQRSALAKSTKGQGFGPQSPRDIDSLMGKNNRAFSEAPAFTEMNLCNIHFHKNAEHKGVNLLSMQVMEMDTVIKVALNIQVI